MFWGGLQSKHPDVGGEDLRRTEGKYHPNIIKYLYFMIFYAIQSGLKLFEVIRSLELRVPCRSYRSCRSHV